jgi:hypothetical protein
MLRELLWIKGFFGIYMINNCGVEQKAKFAMPSEYASEKRRPESDFITTA